MPIPAQTVDAHPTVQQNFDQLAQFLGSLFGGTEPMIRWGTSSATWTASPTSAAVTVNHGLARNGAGVTPAYVIVSLRDPYNAIPSFFDITARTSTTFTYEGRTTTAGNSTGSQNTFWLAIG